MRLKNILLPLVVFTAFSCTGKLEEQVAGLQKSRDSLNVLLNEKQNLLTANEALLTDIENSLTEISGKEKVMLQENQSNQVKEKILAEIQDLKNKIEEYKSKYHANSGIIAGLKGNISRLQATVDGLNVNIGDKDKEIGELKATNEKERARSQRLSQSVDSMSQVIRDKNAAMDEKDAEARKAYYVIGTKKELVAKGILGKNGVQLNGKPDPKLFTQIDYARITSLPIMAKKVSVITAHGKDTYEYFSASTDKTDSLHILKPKEFWSVSKYLVVVVKK